MHDTITGHQSPKTSAEVAEEFDALTEAAALDLLTEHHIDQIDGTAVCSFAWELGGQPCEWTHESGLTALVRRAVEMDRAQRGEAA